MEPHTPQATALLTNWKRPENLRRIIAALRSQSIPVEIFLWNNNPDDREFDVDFEIRSSRNLMCWGRWFMAGYATTPYVFTLDDDLCPVDADTIGDAVEFAERSGAAVGVVGKLAGARYTTAREACSRKGEDIDVEIIKGRFLLCRRDSLKGAPLSGLHPKIPAPRVEDDIIVSSLQDRKILPGILSRRFRNLPEGDVALHRCRIHRFSREVFKSTWAGGVS